MRERFEEWFSDSSWEEFEAKIIEAENEIPVLENKFANETRQALYAKLYYSTKKVAVLIQKSRELEEE